MRRKGRGRGTKCAVQGGREGRGGWKCEMQFFRSAFLLPRAEGENHLCSSQRLLNSYHCRFYLLKNVYSIPFTVTARYLPGRFCSNSLVSRHYSQWELDEVESLRGRLREKRGIREGMRKTAKIFSLSKTEQIFRQM